MLEKNEAWIFLWWIVQDKLFWMLLSFFARTLQWKRMLYGIRKPCKTKANWDKRNHRIARHAEHLRMNISGMNEAQYKLIESLSSKLFTTLRMEEVLARHCWTLRWGTLQQNTQSAFLHAFSINLAKIKERSKPLEILKSQQLGICFNYWIPINDTD